MENLSRSVLIFWFAVAVVPAAGCYDGGSSSPGDAVEDTAADPAGDDIVADPDVPADPGADEDAGPDGSACAVPSECVLAIVDCCGPCGLPALADYDAVNEEFVDEHFAAVCTDPDPICPACGVFPNPELMATCEAGRCTGVDIGAEDITRCTDGSECRVRAAECCECGASMSPDNLVAIRADAVMDYTALLCDPDQGCLECMPVYPVDVQARCGEDGHCETWIVPTP
jgi:hypothetical protein